MSTNASNDTFDSENLAAFVGVNPWLNVSGILALFGVTVRKLCRAKRLLVVALLFLLPSVLTLIVRSQGRVESPEGLDFFMMLNLIATAVVPFSALMFSSGLIQDEVEEQTLTYLMTRPIPSGLIYATKLLASIAVTSALALLCTAINELVIYGAGSRALARLPGHVAAMAALYAVALVAYNALFGLVGLMFRKSLPIGVFYIIIFEGVFASIDFVFRKWTVTYYIRVVAMRWFGDQKEMRQGMAELWSIDLNTSPSAFECLATLLCASLVFLIAGGWVFATREFRVKTPEAT